MPCTGDADETCGNAYRLNAYGPSFQDITANHVVFEHAAVYSWFQVNIDLNLADNTGNANRSNIYGLMVEGSTFENIGSMVPAVFIKPNSMDLEVCMFLDGANICEDLTTATADTWFNLRIEQTCWFYCFVTAYVDETLVFFWWNISPEIFYNVDGVIGNTYNQTDIVAASGKYYDFTLDQSEDGTGLDWLTTQDHDETAAANYVASSSPSPQ